MVLAESLMAYEPLAISLTVALELRALMHLPFQEERYRVLEPPIRVE
jgi:hypothetical protein